MKLLWTRSAVKDGDEVTEVCTTLGEELPEQGFHLGDTRLEGIFDGVFFPGTVQELIDGPIQPIAHGNTGHPVTIAVGWSLDQEVDRLSVTAVQLGVQAQQPVDLSIGHVSGSSR